MAPTLQARERKAKRKEEEARRQQDEAKRCAVDVTKMRHCCFSKTHFPRRARLHLSPVGLPSVWCKLLQTVQTALCPKPATLCRARNAARAKAGDRRSQVQEVRDAAGVAGPDAAKLQVCFFRV